MRRCCASSVAWVLLVCSAAWAQTPVGAAGPTTAPARFELPIGDSGVQWQVIKLGGSDQLGFLDGPTAEMQQGSVGCFGPGYHNSGEGGRMFYGWYDPASGRGHTVAGNGWGCLDGPFSRARFGNMDYGGHPTEFPDKEGRRLVIVDRWNGGISLRCLDFDKQEVSTILGKLTFWGADGFRGLAARDDGAFYMLSTDGTLSLLKPGDWKKETVVKAELPRDVFARGSVETFRTFPLALDEVRGRLYAGFDVAKWWICYWDLKDGSFHGVVPRNPADVAAKAPMGSYDAAKFYPECAKISFGPGDPNRRYLYMTRVDTWQVFRIDLQDRQINGLKSEKVARGGYPQIVKFAVDGNWVPAYADHRWLLDGSGFVSTTHSPTTCVLYKRIK